MVVNRGPWSNTPFECWFGVCNARETEELEVQVKHISFASCQLAG